MKTPEQIAALDAAARSWIGTPFCAGSAVKGAGVCCHRYTGEVYFEAGWIPRFDLPDGYPFGSAAHGSSIFEEYLDVSPYFTDADPERRCAEDALAALIELAEPGDLLLSRPGRVPWHLALYLGANVFAHVCVRHGVQVSDTFPDSWARRIARIYRPTLP